MSLIKWTDEEVQYLKEHWGKIKVEDMQINRSVSSIYEKAKRLNLGPNYASYKRAWTTEDYQYLADNWGMLSMSTIAKNLNRSISAVQQRATDSGLGPFLDAGEYVSLNKFIIEMRGGSGGRTYTINQWSEKGLPIKTKRVKNNSFKVIYLEDFWKWAEKNRTLIDFSKLEPLIFGKEPGWLKEQRRADQEKRYFINTPWTKADDEYLKKLVNQYKFTYREISLKLKRTEGAIKRRVCDLNIKARPIKMSNHNPWTKEETNTLINLYSKGHTPSTIANYISRSAMACGGKIERLIKENVIQPRSEFRKSC